jgi:undecaprenyl diphosphate synthase
MSVPKHVAIILDGNGRWAASRGLPRTAGHTAGAKNVETVAAAAHDLGIEYLTLYAFSTENWNRPADEVKALMNLLDNYLKNCLSTARKNNMRIRVIGDISRLDPSMQDKIRRLESESAVYTGLNLTLAINYGSRDEILRGVKEICRKVQSGRVDIDAMEESYISQHLDTRELPDPDLLIRTSGEQRLSNYLLWQLAYAEFYFTSVPWPDFDKKELEKAVEAYESRDRRYGKV